MKKGTKRISVLMVEDAAEQLTRYVDMGLALGIDVKAAYNLSQAKDCLDKENIDLLITDIHLTASLEQNSFEGLDLITYAKENHPEVLSMVMSSDPKIDTYKKAIAYGALYFIKKPIIESEEIKIAIEAAYNQHALRNSRRSRDEAKLPQEILDKCEDGIVLDTAKRTLCEKLAKAPGIVTVIYGESGTGKEEVAKLIHKKRIHYEGRSIPFIAVNCANLDPSVANSLLFGHTKGAFTGADKATIGYIGEASGGLLFLDEIHCLPIETQRRLLRVLNDGTYQRLGDTKTLISDFQTIVASTQDLDDLVENGKFLIDLRGRLTGFDIYLPPLREHPEDIDLLVPLFFSQHFINVSKSELDKIVARCKEYYWQGNIRQLFKALQTLVALSNLGQEDIKAKNLPAFKSMLAPGSGKTVDTFNSIGDLNEDTTIAIELLKRCQSCDVDLKTLLDATEKAAIKSCLARLRKLGDVAASLGISRSNLDSKRIKYELE